jgi:hypothetical protein
MDVVFVVDEVMGVPNSMIGEAALPDFALASKNRAKGVRISALDELHGVFERDVVRGCEQKMNVFGHNDEGVKLISAFAAMAIHSLQEKANIVFDNEESTSLPGRECNEESSGRGDESSRLQEQTSAAKAAILA